MEIYISIYYVFHLIYQAINQLYNQQKHEQNCNVIKNNYYIIVAETQKKNTANCIYISITKTVTLVTNHATLIF